jgi:archaellum biogenesis ATPase FlaH
MAKKITSIEDAKKLLKSNAPSNKAGALDWLNLRLADHSKPIEAPPVIIDIQGKTILTKGNYCTISGKPKAGKSAYIAGIIAGAITGKNMLGINTRIDAGKNIVHLDTEQGEYEYYQHINQVKQIAGISTIPGNLLSYRLRGIKAEQIRQALTSIAEDKKTGLIIIDGLLDTIIDFNDLHECRMITDILRDTTERNKIGIVCIIHQSKSTNYTIGHLGSFADRFSQSVIEVVKGEKEPVSTMQPVLLRSAQGFEPIHIQYHLSNQCWQLHESTPNEHKSNGLDITNADIDKLMQFLFSNAPYVIYKAIEDAAKSQLFMSSKKVSTLVKQLIEDKLIYKEGNNYFKTITPF